MSETMMVEVNGVKLEVDLRSARRVDTLRVGSRVKVLTKTYDGMKIAPGVVVGFEPFEKLPSIVVCVLKVEWDSAKLEFLTFNKESKDVEVIAALNDDVLEINRADVNAKIEKDIAQKEREIDDMRRRQEFFNKNFAAYFADEREPA